MSVADGIPFLSGDTLITRPNEPPNPTAHIVPMLMSELHKFGSYPVSLAQKIIIVRPDICIAWAGNIIQVALTMEYSETIIHYSVQEYVESILKFAKDKTTDISLIISHVQNGECNTATHDAHKLDFSSWGKLVTAGSGSASFWGYLRHVEAGSPDIMSSDIFGNRSRSTQLLRPMHIEASLQLSMLTGFGSELDCGGFIETAILGNNGFYKFSNDLFVHWIVDKNHPRFVGPQQIFYRTYLDDSMTVRRINAITGDCFEYIIPLPKHFSKFTVRSIPDKNVVPWQQVERVVYMIEVDSVFKTVIQTRSSFLSSIIVHKESGEFRANESWCNQLLRLQFPGIDFAWM